MHGRPSHAFHGVMAAFFLWIATTAEAEVTLPDILASRMVVQRDMPVPVWGTARKGETVTVTFRDQIKTAVADANGKWILRLDPLTAGGPDTMTLAGSDKNSKVITLEDVLVGEVWMGSGQSNMNHFASLIFKDADDLGQPRDAQLEQDVAQTWPTIRLFQRPSKDTTWKLSEPENNLKFSGLLFEFGVQLQKELKVPIGLIVGAEGGTVSGVWIPRETFDVDPGIQKAVANFAPKLEILRRKAQEDLDRWKQTVAATQPNAVPPIRVPVAPSENRAIPRHSPASKQTHRPRA